MASDALIQREFKMDRIQTNNHRLFEEFNMSRWIAFALLPAVGALLGARFGHAQSAAKRPEFEVASIKLNLTPSCANLPPYAAGSETDSPDGFSAKCRQLSTYIRSAYQLMAGQHERWPRLYDVVGGPRWVDSDRYDIAVKAEGPTPNALMRTVMMQALLEERFQLKVHTEARDASVFLLTVIGDKPKFQPNAGCVKDDPEHPLPGPAWDPKTGRYLAPAQRICGSGQGGIDGPNRVMTWYGVSMADFADWCIPVPVGRPVVDRTGLTGLFDIHIEYSPDSPNPQMPENLAPPARAVNEQPRIFEAIEKQLGLKLTSGRAPLDYIVIDHVERPTGN
jgi:uncharacterized protein (TIGR03435 family)